MKLICNRCKNDCKKSGKQLNEVQKYRCKTCGLYQQKNYVYNAYKHEVREQFSRMNRLSESRSYENGLSSNTWNPAGYGNAYYNAFTYDAMGNILTQQRHKRDGTQIEDLTYHYHYNSNGELVRNRLYHVNDAIASSVDSTDIDDMGAFTSAINQLNTDNNYAYDAEGRLVKDVQEEIDTILWTVAGKVKEIRRTLNSDKKNVTFDYESPGIRDEGGALLLKSKNSAGDMGHRIAKHVYNNQTLMLEKSTYLTNCLTFCKKGYTIVDPACNVNETAGLILDAQEESRKFGMKTTGRRTRAVAGRKMAMYDHKVNAEATVYYLAERNIYGSSRLGTTRDTVNMYIPNQLPGYGVVGNRNYELNNHLGNVLAVISDIVYPLSEDSSTVSSYEVGITQISDYSPFGVQLDGRTISSEGYRYSFQGQEHDDEIKGEGNSYTTEFRQYDPRLGRWLSLDPKASSLPWQSPYVSFDNNPIFYTDPLGDIVKIRGSRKDRKRFIQELNAATGNEYRVSLFGHNLKRKNSSTQNNQVSDAKKGISKDVSNLIETMINDSKVTEHKIVSSDNTTLVDGFVNTKIDIDDIQQSCDQVSKTILIGFVMNERYTASQNIDYSNETERTSEVHTDAHYKSWDFVAKIISDFTGEKYKPDSPTQSVTRNSSLGAEGTWTASDGKEYPFVLLIDLNWNFVSETSGSSYQVKITTWASKAEKNKGGLSSDVYSVTSGSTSVP